jgi:hypothetical protein
MGSFNVFCPEKILRAREVFMITFFVVNNSSLLNAGISFAGYGPETKPGLVN